MKYALLITVILTLASCTDSVLDPGELAKKGGPQGGTSDLIFYNREIVPIQFGPTRWLTSISPSNGIYDTISMAGFMTSSPVGNKLVYIADSATGWNSIWITDLKGNFPQYIISDSMIESATLSPDGTTVLYTSTYVDYRDYLSYSRIILVSAIDPRSSSIEVLAADADPSVMPTFSPDGKSVAYAQLVPTGTDKLVVYRIATKTASYFDIGLTPFCIDLEFDWMSDSKRIVCLGENSGQDVVIVDVTNYGAITPLNFTKGTEIPIFPIVSPNGKIAVTGFDLISNTSEIYVYNGTGWDNITNTPGETEVLPHFSADGTKLVYSSIGGPVDPFTTQTNTFLPSSLMLYENGSSRALDMGFIVRPLFCR